MLTKIFNISLCGLFKIKPNTISSGYSFCTTSTPRPDAHPLRSKILSLTSFDEFNSFFKDRKQQFDPSCYSAASRALAKILIESKMYFSFQNRESMKFFLNHLQKIDIDSLSLQQFSQLLYLLRIIKLDPNNGTAFVTQYVRSILERSENKIKELELDSTLSRLSYFYQEYASLGGRHSSIVARRINQLLNTNNNEVEFQHLTVNQINLILKGMRCKMQPSSEEFVLLRNIIKTVLDKHFDKLSFIELSQIAVGINEVSNSSEVINNHLAEQIYKKVLANIDEMDEKSIMFILNGKKTNNKTFNQIYKIIFDKILDQIQPNGESSFNQLFTLRLFNGISDKIKLASTTQQNEDKFFAFFRQTITKTPRFIHSFVQSYVQKGFFNFKQLTRVQEILQAIPDFHLKLSLLYQLSKRNISVEKLLSMDRLKEIELKDKNLIMMASVLERLSEREGPNKAFYTDLLGQVKTRFFDLYKIQDDTFNRLIFNLDNEIIVSLYRLFRKEFQTQLPNPYETEQSQKYRLSWLKIHVHGCNDSFFTKNFSNQLKDKINEKDLQYLFRMIALDRYEINDVLCNVLTLAGKRLDLIMSQDSLIINLAKLMSNQMSSVFTHNSGDIIKSRFWYILNECIEKMDSKKFFDNFSSVINNILKSNYYDLRYSTQYSTLLVKLLQKSEFLKSKFMINELLQECLRLNLIKREHLPTLSTKLKESATLNQNLLLKMIETNQFSLEGVELTKSNLYIFLFNLSPQIFPFIKKNQDKILSLIAQMKPREVWKCISHYRLGSRRQQALIMDSLFSQFTKYTLYFEQLSPVFLGEILRRNNFDKYYSKIDNVKTFYKNALNYFAQRRNIQKISLEDHINLIKSANDLKIRNDDYFHAVFQSHFGVFNIWKRQLFLLAGNMGLQLNQKEIQKLINNNFFINYTSSFSKCFNILIFNEKQLENPGSYLQIIINKYNELKVNEKVPIYALHYEYLKKVYPEETKNFEPNHIEKADFCRSLESLNSKSLNIVRQTIEEITQEKIVQNNIAGNYYYTFRKIALVFPYQTKFFGENNLLKRILTTLTGIEKFALINRKQGNARSIATYIIQNFKGTFTLEEEEKLISILDQKYQQYRSSMASEEAEVQVEAEEKDEPQPITDKPAQ